MRTRTRVLALALVAAAGMGIAGWASLEVAGQVQKPVPVPTYSGCLSAEDGTFYGFSADALGQCEEGDAEASLSSGDVTEVAGGEGITGGAKSGSATVAIAPTHRLPQDCGAGDTVAYDGGGWGCLEPLEPSAFAKSDQTCPPGTVAAGVDLIGKLVCVEQAQAAGPATDWTGLVMEIPQRCAAACSTDILVYNPNGSTARMSIQAFDRDGGSSNLRVFAPTTGAPDCTGIDVPPGGTRECLIIPTRSAGSSTPGAVYLHSDHPVLPFGIVPGNVTRGVGDISWQLDWYPLCPEHVDSCK